MISRVQIAPDHMHLLKNNYVHSAPVNISTVSNIIENEWNRLRIKCPSIKKNVNIQIGLNDTFDTTLAHVSFADVIENGVMEPSTLYDYDTIDMQIILNSNPMNGWHIGDCKNIGVQYNLETVIRHELLHSIGLASTFNGTAFGRWHENKCYLRRYDKEISDVFGNKLVDKCEMNLHDKELYINGIRLYNPSVFFPGSSLSHHVYIDHLMHWQLSPSKCLDMKEEEVKMLSAVGVNCTVEPDSSDPPVSSSFPYELSRWLLLVSQVLLLCLI